VIPWPAKINFLEGVLFQVIVME